MEGKQGGERVTYDGREHSAKLAMIELPMQRETKEFFVIGSNRMMLQSTPHLQLKVHVRVLLFVSLLLSANCYAASVRVAVASNFSAAFQEIAQAFTQQTHITVKASYASSGKLATQIQHGAPFHLFLSADREFASQVEASAYGVDGSRKTYAVGELVLWSLDSSLIDKQLTVFEQPVAGWLALANPKIAPYGVAAGEVMTALGLWEKFENRVVYGENIAQTFFFVKTGNAQLGFVAQSQIINEAGSSWRVPQTIYTPLEQQVVLLKRTEGDSSVIDSAAKKLYDYLFAADTQEIIRRGGYQLRVGGADE